MKIAASHVQTARRWSIPVGSAAALLIAAGKFQGSVTTLRADVDAIQATQPQVMAARLNAQEATQQQIAGELRSMHDSLEKIGNDLAYVRGRIERDPQPPAFLR